MLKERALAATVWSGADVFLRQGLQFAVSVALARLVSPEEFGTIAFLYLFTGIAAAFVDSGFATALIQRQDVTHLTYHPFRWAGISTISHVQRWGCQLVVPRSLGLGDVLDAAPRATHVSFTPSLFRKMMLVSGENALSALPFRQVTFGGEQATQPVLDAARRLWPSARITHTYASTELGDVCSVSDGRAGVPRGKFAECQLDAEGQLFVRGRGTGDLWWRLAGDRYEFVGRVEDVVNVGGAKVHLASVDEAARAVSGVREARAFAVPSPLLGQMITLEYVGDIEPLELQRALRAVLPKISCPARAERVESVALTQAGKIARR